ITLETLGENMQLYQAGITLEAGATYRLTFSAKSSSGHDMAVYVHKHWSPYTDYGLKRFVADLTTSWKPFSVEFVAKGFTGTVSDARLRFWFESFASAGDQYYIDDVVLQKVGEEPPPPPPGQDNVVVNPGFESGLPPWGFYTNTVGTCVTSSPGPSSSKSAKMTITQPGSNVQLFQTGLTLQANTRYRLTFSAYSSTGHDVSVYVQKDDEPFTDYGLARAQFDLEQSWKTYTREFTTTGFSGTVMDGMVRFWFAPFATAGDVYYLDDVHLERLANPTGPLTQEDLARQSALVPLLTQLGANYPNPFNPSTTIEFTLRTAGEVRLEVYNSLGERVAVLASGYYEAGEHMFAWHATNDRGMPLPSGVYFARMQAGDYFATHRMMLLK
ncbi:MAG: Por secretion system C-terminal sorting protein, partial [Bacteroidetes bacterium]|nr:Por secretion system C-terminal sorting protein [Bacteroidota bacterium]